MQLFTNTKRAPVTLEQGSFLFEKRIDSCPQKKTGSLGIMKDTF